MSASIAPSLPDGDVFHEAKQKMTAAVLTFDGDYPVSPTDRECLDAGHALDDDFESHAVEKYGVATDLIHGQLSYSDDQLLTRVTATIRAPINHCLGYLRGHQQQYVDMVDIDNPASITNHGFEYSPRSSYAVNQIQLPYPLSNREYVGFCVWEKFSARSIYFSVVSMTHSEYPESPDFVRMTVARSVKLVAVTPTLTKVTVTSKASLGGRVPRAISDAIILPKAVNTALNMMTYFACVRSPDAYNADDATELGKLTFLKLHPLRKRQEELRITATKVVARNDAFRAFQAKYDFLHEILCTIMRNKVFDLGSSKVTSRAVALTRSEATTIANTFSLLLLSNVTSDAAVDEWILTFLALKDLDEEFSWFRPMMEGVAASLLAETPFGVKLRAYSGAALSLLDMATDSYVVGDMFATGRADVAVALLAMVCANILVQLVIVWVQNRKVERKNNGWMMLRECLYVITFVKPGVDAFRVSSGQDELPGAILSPLQEMVYSKAGELFTEAAPGMSLQCIAFITSEKRSLAALLSILISAGCASMTATTLAYDIDVSPEKRKSSSDMCGMIPDTGRGLAFVVMFSISFLQVTAKCVSLALLAVTNVQWLVYYLAGDMALFLVLKIASQDFLSYVPVPLSAALLVSLMLRTATKTVSDFSGCMMLRNPNDLGGAYFSFNLASTITSVPVITHLYVEHAAVKEGGAKKFSADALWAFSIVIVVLWTLLFGYFMLVVIVPKFRKTFWSTLTGRKRVENIFLDNEEDGKRALIFRKSVILWSRIKEDVKVWTLGSWETWDREKPGWFTDKFVSRVPDEFIPPSFLSKLGAQRKKRDSARQQAWARKSFRG
jgi:hypothetical protein